MHRGRGKDGGIGQIAQRTGLTTGFNLSVVNGNITMEHDPRESPFSKLKKGSA